MGRTRAAEAPVLPQAQNPRVSSTPTGRAPAAPAGRGATSAPPARTAPTRFEAGPQPTQPWAFGARGTPDSEVGRAITAMLGRLRSSGATLNGETAENFFTRTILNNPAVTNDMLLAMQRVPFDRIATAPDIRARVLERIPNARELEVHRFTVALVAGATGLDPARLSEACPDLGMTGSPTTPIFFAPQNPRLQRSTALHDLTDYLHSAGITGLNAAVWGSDNRVISAIISAVFGVSRAH